MVCIGDFWAASEGLDDLIIHIGRMIAYQEYNTKSPLNGLAAKWAAQNSHLLPVDPRPIAPPLKTTGPEILTSPSQPETAMSPTSMPISGAEHGEADPWSEKIVIGSKS
jgi:hypothetical protein